MGDVFDRMTALVDQLTDERELTAWHRYVTDAELDVATDDGAQAALEAAARLIAWRPGQDDYTDRRRDEVSGLMVVPARMPGPVELIETQLGGVVQETVHHTATEQHAQMMNERRAEDRDEVTEQFRPGDPAWGAPPREESKATIKAALAKARAKNHPNG